MIKYFIQDQRGIVSLLWTITLPIILGFLMLIFRHHENFTNTQQVHFITHKAAQWGLTKTAFILREQAEQHYQIQCFVKDPPDICQSSHWRDFLSHTDIYDLITSPQHQNNILKHIHYFLEKTALPHSESFKIQYPFHFKYGDSQIKIQVNHNQAQLPLY